MYNNTNPDMNNGYQNNVNPNMNAEYQNNVNPNMNNGYQNNMNSDMNNQNINVKDKSKQSKKIILIVIVIAILFILYFIGSKSNNSNNGGEIIDKTPNTTNNNEVNNTDNNKTNNNDNSNNGEKNSSEQVGVTEELEKNVTVTFEKTIKGDIILFIKNNNTVTVNISADFIAYDSSNNRIFVHNPDGSIYIDESTKQTNPDPKVVITAFGPGEEIVRKVLIRGQYPNYDHYKLENYEIRVTSGLINNKDVKLVSNKLIKDNTLLQVELNNNSTNSIDNVETYVLYYLDGTPLDIERSTLTIEKGKTLTKNFLIPNDENAKKVVIDKLSWKIYVHAYSYE